MADFMKSLIVRFKRWAKYIPHMVDVAVFDYGAGNIYSIKVALERLGARVDVIHDINYEVYDALILPGVGNFDTAISSIEPYRDRLTACIESDMPILGICLGMEMLFDRSEEGEREGLGIFHGDVVMLPTSVKIPHMGWNRLRISKDKHSTILQGIDDGAWVYFVHSYHTKPKDSSIVKAECSYGIDFPAVIEYKSIMCTQFHPEKSSKTGVLMLKNFLDHAKR